MSKIWSLYPGNLFTFEREKIVLSCHIYRHLGEEKMNSDGVSLEMTLSGLEGWVVFYWGTTLGRVILSTESGFIMGNL